MKRLSLFVVLLLISGGVAAAQPINLVDKPLGTSGLGWRSAFGGDNRQLCADDFTLASAAAVNQLEWSGFGLSTDAANIPFRIRMYADAGGQPVNLPFYEELLGVVPGMVQGDAASEGEAIFNYRSTIPRLDLQPGKYWLMIAAVGVQWAWSHSNPAPMGNDLYLQRNDGSSWTSAIRLDTPPPRLDQAFRVQYVPEPTAALLAWCAVGCVTLVRRR